MSTQVEKFSIFLTKMRKEKGRTQSQFAEDLDVSQQLISLLESDKKKPSPNFIRRLCEKMGLDFKTMIRYAEGSGIHSEGMQGLQNKFLAPDENYLIYIYRELTQEGKNEAVKLLMDLQLTAI